MNHINPYEDEWEADKYCLACEGECPWDGKHPTCMECSLDLVVKGTTHPDYCGCKPPTIPYRLPGNRSDFVKHGDDIFHISPQEWVDLQEELSGRRHTSESVLSMTILYASRPQMAREYLSDKKTKRARRT